MPREPDHPSPPSHSTPPADGSGAGSPGPGRTPGRPGRFWRKLRTRGLRWWRRLQVAAAVVFVTWQVLVLMVGNVVSNWPGRVRSEPVNPVLDRLDRMVYGWSQGMAIAQGWGVFTSPVSRRSPVARVRLEFPSGATVVLVSPVEPADAAWYVKLGPLRQRLLEDDVLRKGGVSDDPQTRELARRYLSRVAREWRDGTWPGETRPETDEERALPDGRALQPDEPAKGPGGARIPAAPRPGEHPHRAVLLRVTYPVPEFVSPRPAAELESIFSIWLDPPAGAAEGSEGGRR